MTTTSPAATLRFAAAAHSVFKDGAWVSDYTEPQQAEVTAIVADRETAEAIVALFPKSVGIRASDLRGSADGTGYVSFFVKLLQDGVNGGRNETGIKRLARLLTVAEKNGLAVEYVTPYANSYPTREDFDAAINA